MNLETGAVTKLRELIADEGNPNLMLRVFVQGGGCSGFQYGFTFEETKNEDDFDFAYDEVRVVVDAMSMQYLNGASIDYKEDLQGASFTIKNPQAASTCGCGSSFSVQNISLLPQPENPPPQSGAGGGGGGVTRDPKFLVDGANAPQNGANAGTGTP